MRAGQTSFITFASKLVSSAAGFVATIYFARILGASVLGTYYLLLSIVGWLTLLGSMGVGRALTKRLSEQRDQGEFKVAGAFLIGLLTLGIVLGVVLLQEQVDRYFGIENVEFIVVLLVVALANSYVDALLKGVHLVYVYSLLRPVRRIARTVVQTAAVFVGLGLMGMVVGYAAGGVLVVLLGFVIVGTDYRLPTRRHVRELVSFAKYSWLGSLESKTFHEADILLLGLFVTSGAVGVYGITWNIAGFLILFSSAITTALFPEISKLSAQEGTDSVVSLVEDSIGYAGLFPIPGFFGGLLLSQRILAIYGEEFTDGASILGILILSVLFYSYQSQFVNALGAIDRPDAAFRVNAVLIGTNVCLNLVLIYFYGVVGAAVATASSTALSMVTGYLVTRRYLPVTLPVREVGRQVLAALGMSLTVVGAELALEGTDVVTNDIVVTGLLVLVGAGAYFCLLLTISKTFRTTVRDNVPTEF